MNAQVLIDCLVRQTTVLIAQVATSGGVRAPLAHVANQVFLDLARELDRQGISRKVSADMFGMALRSYRRRVQQLAASSTERDCSLWEAVLKFIQDHSMISREAVLKRFSHDDEVQLRAVLRDLVDAGLVFASGQGPKTLYRACTSEELAALAADRHICDELTWGLVYREGPVSRERLGELAPAAKELDQSLARLVEAGRIECRADGTYSSASMVIPLESSAGWEAAVLDHFQALVSTLCARLAGDNELSAEEQGGSTYRFTLWPGHPFEQEVRGLLREFRQRHTALRQRVQGYNAQHAPASGTYRVTFYGGQSQIRCDEGSEDAETGQ